MFKIIKTVFTREFKSYFDSPVAYVFLVVARHLLSVSSLDILEELRNICIITESDISLCILTCKHYIVALILTSELIVILNVILSARVALD